jgi:hypothetical protein
MTDYLQNVLRRPPVGWWDVLDILAVSILIYEALKLIRGTRAEMAVGSLLVLALFYVSQLAPLQTLNWLIRNALVYVAFAAIVIFQSDIRRALAHFGQAPFFRYFTRQQASDETIEEVVVATAMLSEKKVGGIIALEREIGLRNYIESGIPLDATLTDLWRSLPGLLRRRRDPGRTRGRGGALPAADQLSHGRRAPARDTARSDRLEGNDRVRSWSRRNGIFRSRSKPRSGDLRRHAAGSPAPPHSGTEGLMRYNPFRNLGLKVLAVILATLLWITVAGEHVVERSLRVPLEFRNVPETLEIVGNTPDTVDVRLRGCRRCWAGAGGRDRGRPGSEALRGTRVVSYPRKEVRAVRRGSRKSFPRRFRSSWRSRRGGVCRLSPRPTASRLPAS